MPPENSEKGLKIVPITKRYLNERMGDFLKIEYNWTGIGEKPWTDKNYLHELPHKFDLSFSAEDRGYGNKIVGYIISSCPEEGCQLSRVNKVVVDVNYRGKGIGRSLIERYVQACDSLGILFSELKVLPTNEHAINLYFGAGYEKVGEVVGKDNKMRLVCQKKIGGEK